MAILAFDVSEASLSVYARLGEVLERHEFSNRSATIRSELSQLATVAEEDGFSRCLVVAEPTGVYHQALFRIALGLGMETAFVGGEAVAKMRVIESNDDGKTDIKDPRVIELLASIGKTLTHRQLPEPYSLLREWHRRYERADQGVVAAKNGIHTALKRLFPDLDFSPDFIFGRSGRAVMKGYGFNPYRIVRSGKRRFERKMKRLAPRIQNRSLERLLRQAEASVVLALSDRESAFLEGELGELFDDLARCEQRKQRARRALEDLYDEAREDDPGLPPPVAGVLSKAGLARVIAETGPLSDFEDLSQVERMLGINLRERRSGKWRGKTKISKKGRSRGRKALDLLALPLVSNGRLYADYYRDKRATMEGPKAMMAVARKVLKMIWGLYGSDEAFNPDRVFCCESQWRKAA